MIIVWFFLWLIPLQASIAQVDASSQINDRDIINLINIERSKNSLGELVFNDTLRDLAILKTNDMKNNGYFDHYSPDGRGLKYFLNAVKYDYAVAGENLAINFYDDNEVVQAWMNSKSHRFNILHPDFTEVALAHDYIMLNGKNQFVITLIFGKRK